MREAILWNAISSVVRLPTGGGGGLMAKIYTIAVHGCDDSTYITRELTETEHTFLQAIAKQITDASTYGCEPTMTVYEEEEPQ